VARTYAAAVAVAPYRYRQTLVVRILDQRPLASIIAALNDFTEQQLLGIVDAQIVAGDSNGTIAAVTVEHLWWSRLSEALGAAGAELVSDLESPKSSVDGGPGPEQIRQIHQLNEMRRIGILTEAEFADAKRKLLAIGSARA
jgi:hypothetical protein